VRSFPERSISFSIISIGCAIDHFRRLKRMLPICFLGVFYTVFIFRLDVTLKIVPDLPPSLKMLPGTHLILIARRERPARQPLSPQARRMICPTRLRSTFTWFHGRLFKSPRNFVVGVLNLHKNLTSEGQLQEHWTDDEQIPLMIIMINDSSEEHWMLNKPETAF
jgi:hypothetical protein